MKFVLAPDSFKESMTAKEVCIAMEKGIKKVFENAKFIHIPMADGGEGTMQSLIDCSNGKLYEEDVIAPMGNIIKAKYGIMGDEKTAVIEMAEASGIGLVERNKRNPLNATTYGTGQLIKAALDKGVQRIIIGIGGSATNDGGCGMLQALGVSFKDKSNNEISYGGGALSDIDVIDVSNLDKRIYDTEIIAACDVENTLCGKNGASYVFGPQKGADPNMVEVLDKNLRHYAEVVKQTMNIDIDNVKGAGAAGGLGAALVGFLKAELKKGIDIVIEYTKLEEALKNADYVFTGEGSIDFQTKFGKTPVGVSIMADKYNVPVIALAGKVGDNIDSLYNMGITGVFGILPGITDLEEALKNGSKNVEITSENIARILVRKN